MAKFNFPSDAKVSVGIAADAYRYYAMETPFSVENLNAFVQQFVDGKLVGKEASNSSKSNCRYILNVS